MGILARHLKSIITWGATILIIIVALFYFFKIRTSIAELKYVLTPPELPKYEKASDTKHINKKGWNPSGEHDAEWFHHASQGTATLPIPYQWLLALEEPRSSPWYIMFPGSDQFMDEYILRLGFIEGKETEYNRYALPIGFATTDSIYFAGLDREAVAVGFTCAACHTGQFVYKDEKTNQLTRYVVDGGPAVTDLGLLTQSLGAALGQTALSSKLPVFNGRFNRFAKRVLGSNDNIVTRNQLKTELVNTIAELSKTSDTILVTEGFSRLDALNRIGNQVFATDMNRPRNYSPINAPVNYPHIWTTSWFDWVQYDGSIMQPLVRNSGEALGVAAYVNTTAGEGRDNHERFASSVNINNLYNMEQWLGGTHPVEGKAFNGLQAPKWPDSLPAIQPDLATAGKALYQEKCQHCHLPATDTEEFWSSKHWKPIVYKDNGKLKETEETYLNLNIIPLSVIGTDPAQARVLPHRTVDTTGLNLDTEVCSWPAPLLPHPNPKEDSKKTLPQWPFNKDGDKDGYNAITLQTILVTDSPNSMFGLALGAFVSRTNEQWFYQNYIVSEEQRSIYEGLRPNCLQVGQGYKARPLNGVWATAPFLHNGSVPTLYDLLSTQEERPAFVELGNQHFDPVNVGIVQGKKYKHKTESYRTVPDYKNGRFVLDTREPGNFNTGHLFDSNGGRGVIGETLSHTEKMQLIEYIKTL